MWFQLISVSVIVLMELFYMVLFGNGFGFSFRGEILGWALFFAGIAAVAFGSAYYHLMPDDDRAMWDNLPVRTTILLFNSLRKILTLNHDITCLLLENVG